MKLSTEQITEVEKIISYIEKMESIVRTTTNEEQKQRVKKELYRYHKKMVEINPALDLSKKTIKQIRQEIHGSNAAIQESVEDTETTKPKAESGFKVLDKFEMQPASPNCTDNDINFLATLFNLIHLEYWPAFSDRHTKMDFSNAQERDGIRMEIDNVMRNMGVLIETIEEFAKAEKQDFREQLLKMKNRQSRTFIYEANEALKKMKVFLSKLADDVNDTGGLIMNMNDKIVFNTKFEQSTLLTGYTVKNVILEFFELVKESIQYLNLPVMKIKT